MEKDIKLYLPERKLKQLRNECDRFGFSYLISEMNNMQNTPIAKCSWVHGWHWYPLKINDILKGSKEYFKRSNIVVATNSQAAEISQYLNSQNVVVAGLPFSYVQNPKVPRKNSSVIAFLPKSLSENDEHVGARSFVDYLKNNRKKFMEPTICIFGGDALRVNLVEYIKKSGFNYIIGADPQDINSLMRIKVILSYYEYAIGPTVGSYLPYAHAMGCKAFIVDHYVKVSTIKESHYHSYEYVENKFPFLFKRDLTESELYTDWANDVLGARSVLPPNKVKELFGWTIKGTLQHYSRAITSRIFK
jgi:hypothetical protein